MKSNLAMKSNIFVGILIIILLALLKVAFFPKQNKYYDSSSSSGQKGYNIYQIGKGEILKNDYYYLEPLVNDMLIAVPLVDSVVDYDHADLSGVINFNETEIIPFQYRNIQIVRDIYKLYKEKIPLLAISNGSGRALFKYNNSTFEQMTDFSFLKFRPYLFDGDYLAAHRWNCHVLNLKDTSLFKTKFDDFSPLTSNLVATEDVYNGWGIMNKKGDTILQNQYDKIGLVNDSLIFYQRNDSIGLLKTDGDEFLPNKFNRVVGIKNRLLAQKFPNGRQTEYTDPVKDRLSLSKVIVKNGEETIYKSYSYDEDNIKQNGFFGAYDFQGNLKIPFEYDLLVKGIEPEVLANKNGKFGVVSEDGVPLIDFLYDDIQIIMDQFYLVKNENGQGLFTRNNKQILELKPQKIFPISKSEVLHTENNFWYKTSFSKDYKIKKQKQTELTANYDLSYLEISDPNSRGLLLDTNYFAISNGQRFGIINKNQKLIVQIANITEPKYSNGKFFELDQLYTIKGGTLVNVEIGESTFEDGSKNRKTLIVKKGGKYGVINLKGKTIIPFNYSAIQKLNDKKFLVYKGEIE